MKIKVEWHIQIVILNMIPIIIWNATKANNLLITVKTPLCYIHSYLQVLSLHHLMAKNVLYCEKIIQIKRKERCN